MSYSHYLKQVLDLIGHQSTIRLVRAKGGRDIKIPYASNLSDEHWLVMTVGIEEAKKLCEYFKGTTLKLPIEINALIQLRNDAIVVDFNRGVSISELARNYQVDRKLIQNILDKFGLRGKPMPHQAEDQQLGLGV